MFTDTIGKAFTGLFVSPTKKETYKTGNYQKRNTGNS